MNELGNVLDLTKTTFNLYTKAKNNFKKNYQDSFNLSGKSFLICIQ